MKTSTAVGCVRVIRDTKPALYALPDDGRKSRLLQADRRTLTMQLATFADGDGTRITPGATRLFEALGWGRNKLFERLEDLKRLGFLTTIGRTGERGTARRQLNVEFIQKKVAEQESVIGSQSPGLGETKSPGLASQSPGLVEPESGIGELESVLGADSTDTQTDTYRPPTDPAAGGPVSAAQSSQTQPSITVDKTLDALDALYIDAFGIVPRGSKSKALVSRMIEKEGHDRVVNAFGAAIRAEAWRAGTFAPYEEFVKGYKNFARLAERHSKEDANKLDVKRTYEQAKAAHAEQWGLNESAPEPSAEGFLENAHVEPSAEGFLD